MLDCINQPRWYDAEIARMMLDTANSNCPARPLTHPQGGYFLSVAATAGLAVLGALNLFA